MLQAHAAQDIGGLGELDVVVADDLDAVAPGIAEIQERPRKRIHACIEQLSADGFLIVDNKAEVTSVVGALAAAFLERDELIAEIDESRALALASQREMKSRP